VRERYGMVWYGTVEFNVPLDNYRSFRRRFYGPHDPTNSVIALKDDVRERLVILDHYLQ